MRADLPAMVGQSVRLARVGKRYRGCCPFHEEKTPSFYLIPDPDRWRFHCWGCGAHGDAIDWLRLTRKLTFKEARDLLGQHRTPPPTAEEKRQRRLRDERVRRVRAYRDRSPDCCIPEWAIA